MNSSKSGMKRVLGLAALTFYGVGDILGAGIYALVGKVAGIAGPAVWMSFLTAFFVAAMTAFSYAELSSRMPRAAGAAVFTLEAFKRPALSYVIGFMVLFSDIVSMAASSHAFAGYVTKLSPGFSENIVIFIFFLLLAAINLKGMKESSTANVICTLVEITGLFIVIAAGMRFWGQVNLLSIEPVANTQSLLPAVAILQGGALAFYAFIGFEDLANVAEEAKDPHRALPRAILLSLFIGASVYILVSISAVSALSGAELSASKAPLVDVVKKGFPAIPVWIFSLIALFAVANTALLNFVMGSRVLYGMSADKLVPQVFGKLNSKTHTPHWAILAVWGVVLVIAYSGSLVILAESTSLLLLSVFLFVNAALIVLKLRTPHPKDTFQIPLIIPVLGVLSTLGLAFFIKLQAFKIVGCIVLAIIGFYFLSRIKAKKT